MPALGRRFWQFGSQPSRSVFKLTGTQPRRKPGREETTLYRSSPYDRASLIADFDSIRISLGESGKNPVLVARRSHQAGDHQLPHLQARTGRPVLRQDFRSRHRLGMPVRQVQAHEASRRDLRQVRRRSHAEQSPPRAPRPHRAGFALLARLVLQGPAHPHRLPAGHFHARSRAHSVLRSLRRRRSRAKSPCLKEREMLPEEKYRELHKEYPGQFRAKMGAEAIKELLHRVEVEKLSEELREKMKVDPSLQKRIKYAKRLKVLESFRKSGNKPEWMILDVHPGASAGVAPAGASGRRPFRHFRSERSLSPRHQPQQPVEEADGAARARTSSSATKSACCRKPWTRCLTTAAAAACCAAPTTARSSRLSDTLKGKQGRFRQNLLGKRVDYSGRSVIVVGPELKLQPVRSAQEDGARAFQAVHLSQARSAGPLHHHQASQGNGRAAGRRRLGHSRRRHSRASRAAQPRSHACTASAFRRSNRCWSKARPSAFTRSSAPRSTRTLTATRWPCTFRFRPKRRSKRRC